MNYTLSEQQKLKELIVDKVKRVVTETGESIAKVIEKEVESHILLNSKQKGYFKKAVEIALKDYEGSRVVSECNT